MVKLYASYLTDNEPMIREAIMWGLSNIACCEAKLSKSIFEHQFLIQNIIDLTINDFEFKVN